jgi:DNA-binding transcriptional ArsR family regulator
VNSERLRSVSSRVTLSHMAQSSATLDRVFAALADPTRRAVVQRLGGGPASVGELALPFPITLPSFMKHVHALEACGLIRTKKAGRVRTCTLNPQQLALADDWLERQRGIWQARTDRLDDLVTNQKDPTP